VNVQILKNILFNMIQFINDYDVEPYNLFKEKYNAALSMNQSYIEAISVSSFSLKENEVNSRFVNLKFVDGNKFIFFTNYNSPKANQFLQHNQISINIFWDSINTQIRFKAKIKKTSLEYNQKYFSNRSESKNALAISSNQSSKIGSYDQIIQKYNISLNEANLRVCPKYWGGFYFIPYEMEFWVGHHNRINKRILYQLNNADWKKNILEP